MEKTTHDFKPTPFLQSMATILEPNDSVAPILVMNVRQIIHQWMAEVNAVEELESVGLIPRKMLLFFGIPGCGKTTLAHHIAARLGVPLVVINMQAIVSCYLGATGNNIDHIFKDLRNQAENCVLFMDEFDSIATQRQNGNNGVEKELNSIVIALLQKMDEYNGTMIAATNLGYNIDPAIWRRFQLHVDIGAPDFDCRYAIIKRYLLPFDLSDKALTLLASATSGATPALLRQFSESIKRDMVLAKKLNYSNDAESVLNRAVKSAIPHSVMVEPELWKNPSKCANDISSYWPPTRTTNEKE